MVELSWGNSSAWAGSAQNAGCCRLTLESWQFFLELPVQISALPTTCRVGQESHLNRAESGQTTGLHSDKAGDDRREGAAMLTGAHQSIPNPE